MIFLDRAETQKFIAKVREMLDSKASVLSNNYPIDEPFLKDELRKLAESLDIDSIQELLDKAKLNITKLENE